MKIKNKSKKIQERKNTVKIASPVQRNWGLATRLEHRRIKGKKK